MSSIIICKTKKITPCLFSSLFYSPSKFLILCSFVFSTHLYKRLCQKSVLIQSLKKKKVHFPKLTHPGWGFFATYFIFENVHEKLLTLSNLKTLAYKHSLVSEHCHSTKEKEDVYKIYIAERDFYVLCALHLYFQLKSLSDYFLKEFCLSWGRLKIMSTR